MLHPCDKGVPNLTKRDRGFLKAGKRDLAPSWWQISSELNQIGLPNLTKRDRRFLKVGKRDLAPPWWQSVICLGAPK